MRNEALLPIAQFLGRVWSDNKETKVVISSNNKIPSTNLITMTIYMPTLGKIPIIDMLSKYRVWRFSLFHESMHVKHSNAYDIYDIHRKHVNLFRFITNVIEDYRIEELGKLEYPGMIVEQEFDKAIMFGLCKKPNNILEQFGQMMLFGFCKDMKYDEIDEKVIKAVKYVKQCFTESLQHDSTKLADKVIEILGLQDYNEPIFNLVIDVGLDALTEEYTDVGSKKKKITKRNIEEFVEDYVTNKTKSGKSNEQEESKDETLESYLGRDEQDIDIDYEIGEGSKGTNVDKNELLEPSKEVLEEFDAIEKKHKMIENMREREKDDINISLPSKLDVNEEEYYDMQLINHLKSQLRKLRKGFVEIQSYTGEFDVDSYISKHYKPFIDEERLKVKNIRVLLLLDHSGSIDYYQKTYKKATIALAEALNALNVKYAIYVFNEFKNYQQLYLVKSFNEEWSRTNAKRLVQIEADGGTPLTEMYDRLKPIVLKYSDRNNFIFITLTDGMPDNVVTCKQRVSLLKKHCTMVAIGFGYDIKHALEITKNLKTLDYDRYVALDNIIKLPEKVLGLLD